MNPATKPASAYGFIPEPGYLAESQPYQTDREYLESASAFDPTLTFTHEAFQPLIDRVLDMVQPTKQWTHQPKLVRRALDCILANLWIASIIDKPVHYPRRKNAYTRPRRYGLRHYSYARIPPLMDCLEKLGFVEQFQGFRTEKKRRRTRAAPLQPLCDLFNSVDGVQIPDRKSQPLTHGPTWYPKAVVGRERPGAALFLKKAKDSAGHKKLVNYKDTAKTRKMTADVKAINGVLDKAEVLLIVPDQVLASIESKALIRARAKQSKAVERNRNRVLKSANQHGWTPSETKNKMAEAEVEAIRRHPVPGPSGNITLEYALLKGDAQEITQEVRETRIQTVETHRCGCISQGIHREWVQCYMNGECPHTDYAHTQVSGNSEAPLRIPSITDTFSCNKLFSLRIFEVSQKSLTRTFNNNRWNQGGRFYGALHEGLPKELRRRLFINGQSTVEEDFGGMHIRMLYHREGIDYHGDPYQALCDSRDPAIRAVQRKAYKLVLLICINVASEDSAAKAIRKAFKESEIQVDLKVEDMIRRFKTHHQPIARYLAAGEGLSLQYLDSVIANNIMMKGVKQGVAMLPVHDSFIVQQRHGMFLCETMAAEYAAVMGGFSPVLG